MRNYTYDPSLHTQKDNPQRPCFAILRRAVKHESWQSDFRGEIELQDGTVYSVGLSVGFDRDGEPILRLYLRPPLQKTPITPGRLEVVK
jgi:hypothetical protein